MRPALRAVPVLVSALLLAGCGDGGTTTATEEAPGTPVAAAGAAPASPESTKAAAATLQPGDFPAGFQPQPEEPGQGLSIERVWEELTRCLGVDAAAGRTGIATSPTFLRGLATQGRATVEYTSEATAGAVAAALAGPRFQSCATNAFNADVKRSAPEGGVPGPVTVTPAVAPPVAQRISAIRITVTINLDELKVPLFQDFLVAFERGALIRFFFLNPGSEFPQDLERSLMQQVISRV
jgi:hypothetical protein